MHLHACPSDIIVSTGEQITRSQTEERSRVSLSVSRFALLQGSAEDCAALCLTQANMQARDSRGTEFSESF